MFVFVGFQSPLQFSARDQDNFSAKRWETDRGGHWRPRKREVSREEKSEELRQKTGDACSGITWSIPGVRYIIVGSLGRSLGVRTVQPDGSGTSPASVERRETAGVIDSGTP